MVTPFSPFFLPSSLYDYITSKINQKSLPIVHTKIDNNKTRVPPFIMMESVYHYIVI